MGERTDPLEFKPCIERALTTPIMESGGHYLECDRHYFMLQQTAC